MEETPFNGKLDDIRFWDRALTNEEILELLGIKIPFYKKFWFWLKRLLKW